MLVLFSGLLAGAAHVVLGPDHLAAVIPLALQRPRAAVQIGLRWGTGHAAGVLILACLGLLFREQLEIDALSAWAEALVGAALIFLGLWALRSTRGLVLHSHHHDHQGTQEEAEAHAHLHLHQKGLPHHDPAAHRLHSHAPGWLGLLHGLAGASHLLALLPSLALPTPLALLYLGAYLGASIAAMSLFSWGIGRISRRAAPRLLLNLSYGSAGGAIILGGIWLVSCWPT